jgi:hypothetical protein
MATLEERAYELALRALGQQQEVLRELRSRTGTLLAAASITASFLGAQALGRSTTLLAAPALLAFLASMTLSVSILLPNRRLCFSLGGQAVHGRLHRLAEDEQEVDRRLANWLDSLERRNEPIIEALFRRFRWAGVTLMIEIACWTAELALE